MQQTISKKIFLEDVEKYAELLELEEKYKEYLEIIEKIKNEKDIGLTIYFDLKGLFPEAIDNEFYLDEVNIEILQKVKEVCSCKLNEVQRLKNLMEVN